MLAAAGEARRLCSVSPEARSTLTLSGMPVAGVLDLKKFAFFLLIAE